MDYSLDWIIEKRREYVQKTGMTPVSPSDWVNERDDVQLPRELLKTSLNESVANTHKYSFMYDVQDSKEFILNKALEEAGKEKPDIDLGNICIAPNSTSALYLAIRALRDLGARRFLIVTPTYFSILETLKDLSLDTTFFHLKDSSEFEINTNEITTIIKTQFIDVIIFTDPIFCTGKEVPFKLIQTIQTLSEAPWIIIDKTLGNMNWERLEDINIIGCSEHLILPEKLVIIDSITKRLFANGLKIATCLAPSDVVTKMESDSNFVIGGLTAAQVQLVKTLYSGNQAQEVKEIIAENLKNIRETYVALKSLVTGTEFTLYPTQCGIYTMLVHESKRIASIDSKSFVDVFLESANALILPSCRFAFYKENKAGFRVNLSKNKHFLIETLLACIRVDSDRF